MEFEHKNCTWNAVFSDQFGDQTYIRDGKAKGGLVGLTLSSEQVAGWVLSHHTCNLVSGKIDKVYLNVAGQAREFSKEENVQKSTHKETGKNRKELDAQDRMKISEKLSWYTNPIQIQITADDTDIFVLAVYFLHKYSLKANIVMKKNNGRFIDINSSAESLGTKCLDLLALHAASGCNSVSFPYGKGKSQALMS